VVGCPSGRLCLPLSPMVARQIRHDRSSRE
jgi:hypothetical protein